jgi:predicted nucleic acid-binding protein
MIIAAIAEVNGCVIVTDNDKDFAGLTTINPMRA